MEISEKDLEKLVSTLETCIQRIENLERQTSANRTLHEQLRSAFDKSEFSTNGLLQTLCNKYKKQSANLALTMAAVCDHNKALFPERYVEGASPNLRLILDPEKMV